MPLLARVTGVQFGGPGRPLKRLQNVGETPVFRRRREVADGLASAALGQLYRLGIPIEEATVHVFVLGETAEALDSAILSGSMMRTVIVHQRQSEMATAVVSTRAFRTLLLPGQSNSTCLMWALAHRR